MGSDFLNKHRVSFRGDENILELDSSDSCIILQIPRLTLRMTLMQDADHTLENPCPFMSTLKWNSQLWFDLLTSQSNSVQ